MPTITFNTWGFGLDLRKGPSTSDANRLRVLKNAYVTDGKTIRKRPGCIKVGTLSAGTIGLFPGLGQLNTFQVLCSRYPTAITHASVMFTNNVLNAPDGSNEVAGENLIGIDAVEPFNGYLYVAAVHHGSGRVQFPGGGVNLGETYRHHYVDLSGNTYVPAAPLSRGITKAASKVWATDGDVVRFCSTNNPRDWTTSNDAGFLPVGLQQSGSKISTTLGNYGSKLVVFFTDSSQIWTVDPDPANNTFDQTVDIGTLLLYAHQNMASDVFFLSPAGVRTITAQVQTQNLIDADVGSPIDLQLLRGAFIDTSNARAQYFRGAGQYWLFAGNRAMVFTYSRSAKISAWSVYEFPFTLDYLAELDTFLYIRSGNDVYRMDRDTWTDAGTKYQVEIETSFVDFKTPGELKQILALDAVVTGSADFSHRFDPRNPALETSPPVRIVGDTRPGALYPVELLTPNLCTVVRNFDDQEFEWHAVSYMFQSLGAV